MVLEYFTPLNVLKTVIIVALAYLVSKIFEIIYIMRIQKRKKERIAKGIPVKEWWQKRRNDIIEERMPEILKRTYNGSLEKGERWPQEFREFWGLPSDFTFKVEEV